MPCGLIGGGLSSFWRVASLTSISTCRLIPSSNRPFPVTIKIRIRPSCHVLRWCNQRKHGDTSPCLCAILLIFPRHRSHCTIIHHARQIPPVTAIRSGENGNCKNARGGANRFGLHWSLCDFAADRDRRPPFRALSGKRIIMMWGSAPPRTPISESAKLSTSL